MLHEAKVIYKTRDDDGKEIVKKEWYVVENCERFMEVEEKLFQEFDVYSNEFDVTDIKRSKIKEIANARQYGADALFVADVKDVFLKDDGTEKDIKYKILFFAMNFDEAKKYISDYLKQGYNMSLIGLKESKFIDVI